MAGIGAVAILVGATLVGLRIAHAPPFVRYVRMPRVLGMAESAAVGRVKAAGLEVRIVSLRRSIPSSVSHHVLGVSNSPNERLARGSTVTLYVAIRRAKGRKG
jgi:beta-lactam-binding protein with PASTA domain